MLNCCTAPHALIPVGVILVSQLYDMESAGVGCKRGLICFMQSLVAARNMVVQRLRAITDERRRLMAALHSFVLQVGTTQRTDHACNDSAAVSVVYTVRAQASLEAMMRSCRVLCACACMSCELLEMASHCVTVPVVLALCRRRSRAAL